jgi:hypothetical protein
MKKMPYEGDYATPRDFFDALADYYGVDRDKFAANKFAELNRNKLKLPRIFFNDFDDNRNPLSPPSNSKIKPPFIHNPMKNHDDDTCPHLVRANLLEAENARLKAEVERLTEAWVDKKMQEDRDALLAQV